MSISSGDWPIHGDLTTASEVGTTAIYQSQEALRRYVSEQRLQKFTHVFPDEATDAGAPREYWRTLNLSAPLGWRCIAIPWRVSPWARFVVIVPYGSLTHEDMQWAGQVNATSTPTSDLIVTSTAPLVSTPMATVAIDVSAWRGEDVLLSLWYRGDIAGVDGDSGQTSALQGSVYVVSVGPNTAYSGFANDGFWPAISGHEINPHRAIQFGPSGTKTDPILEDGYKHLLSCPLGDGGSTGIAVVSPPLGATFWSVPTTWTTYYTSLAEIESLYIYESVLPGEANTNQVAPGAYLRSGDVRMTAQGIVEAESGLGRVHSVFPTPTHENFQLSVVATGTAWAQVGDYVVAEETGRSDLEAVIAVSAHHSGDYAGDADVGYDLYIRCVDPLTAAVLATGTTYAGRAQGLPDVEFFPYHMALWGTRPNPYEGRPSLDGLRRIVLARLDGDYMPAITYSGGYARMQVFARATHARDRAVVHGVLLRSR